MTFSMTAFGSAKISTASGTFNCEIRCVNHRFLDVNFRLPEELRAYESNLKDAISRRITRGRVDCFIRREENGQQLVGTELDQSVLDNLLSLARSVAERDSTVSNLRMIDVLRWPGVMKTLEVDADEIKQSVLKLIDQALESVETARRAEGDKLQLLIKQRISEMREIVSSIQQQLPAIQLSYRTRLEEKLESVLDNMDEIRIEQEMVLFLNKTDVMEELDRLIVHFDEVESTLQTDKAKGRRLDFLMQELNREANTLGSKSQDAQLTKQSVELKVLIEQMREQVQNIE